MASFCSFKVVIWASIASILVLRMQLVITSAQKLTSSLSYGDERLKDRVV
jgi:hypothetical protein